MQRVIDLLRVGLRISRAPLKLNESRKTNGFAGFY